MKTVLTIAGSDCSGGAGIQADIKTITAHKLYAESAITSLTAQNTMGVTAISDVTPDFLTAQLDAIFTDIPPDAVKIGMVSNANLIRTIAHSLEHYQPAIIVIDPVMVSTSGSNLLDPNAQATLIDALLPLGTVITPNIPEAETLSNMSISNADEMMEAAKKIFEGLGGNTAILLKGGHSVNDANDLLFADGKSHWFKSPRIETTNTHGTGCTLSSAIACNLAMGHDLTQSIYNAKSYLNGALSSNLDFGQGSGPLEHTWWL